MIRQESYTAHLQHLQSLTMRVASRHMPKFVRRPMGLFGWLSIACALAAVAYLAFAESQAFLVALGGLLALVWLSRQRGQREARQLLALASQREGQSICDFARDFNAREVDTWVMRAVYEQLQGKLKHMHPAFPVRADDRLKEDLLLDDDDFDMELAQEVEMRTGRSLDSSATNPYFGKVKTVRDFVLFFQNQPRSASATQ